MKPEELAQFGKYHVAYAAYITTHESKLRELHAGGLNTLDEFELVLRSRRTRVLKIDGDLDGSEIDIPGNADTDLIEPSVGDVNGRAPRCPRALRSPYRVSG